MAVVRIVVSFWEGSVVFFFLIGAHFGYFFFRGIEEVVVGEAQYVQYLDACVEQLFQLRYVQLLSG